MFKQGWSEEVSIANVMGCLSLVASPQGCGKNPCFGAYLFTERFSYFAGRGFVLSCCSWRARYYFWQKFSHFCCCFVNSYLNTFVIQIKWFPLASSLPKPWRNLQKNHKTLCSKLVNSNVFRLNLRRQSASLT